MKPSNESTSTMQVTLFTKPNCGPCAAVKYGLTSRGLPFAIVDVSADHGAADRVVAMGYRQMPVVLVERPGQPDEHWSGMSLERICALAAEWRLQDAG